MTETNPTAYFQALATALEAMQVTDGSGASLPLDAGAARLIDALRAVRSAGGKVMVVGNGGSAAIASHMHNDLFKIVGVRSLNFLDVPLFSALSNDCGYATVYEKPIEMWSDRVDLLVAISSSGRSENILRAAAAAARRGCQTATFSGFAPDNPLRSMGTLNFYVPSSAYGFVELAHQTLAHFLTDAAGALEAVGV
jgi:D-sedoheptulose 7-phosphate isomerase